MNHELKHILTRFSESGWDLIDAPARDYLNGTDNTRAVDCGDQAGGQRMR